jgi:hypothetical protein
MTLRRESRIKRREVRAKTIFDKALNQRVFVFIILYRVSTPNSASLAISTIKVSLIPFSKSSHSSSRYQTFSNLGTGAIADTSRTS